MICQVGDWVRFMWNCQPLIGEVLYRKKEEVYPYKWYLYTTLGTVREDGVLERRGAEKEVQS